MPIPIGSNGEVSKTLTRDTTAAYGNYLAVSVPDCNRCHTKRDISGIFTGKPFAGGNDIEGFITLPHPDGKIYNWTK